MAWQVPLWVEILSWIWLILGFTFTAVIALDVRRHRQKMAVMNVVWAVTALYGGPIAWWGYRRIGRRSSRDHIAAMMRTRGEEIQRQKDWLQSLPATRAQVLASVTHCGAGCTLGDIVAEWWHFLHPFVWLGGAFTSQLGFDFALAWGFGVVFQYLTIAPMRGLRLGPGIWAAIKADTISIVAFEVGLFGWMALSRYVFFSSPPLQADRAAFWFMMQAGMIIGFVTCYPANRWLLRRGLKERMPAEPDAALQFGPPPAR